MVSNETASYITDAFVQCAKKMALNIANKLYFRYTPEMSTDISLLVTQNDDLLTIFDDAAKTLVSLIEFYTECYINNNIIPELAKQKERRQQ